MYHGTKHSATCRTGQKGQIRTCVYTCAASKPSLGDPPEKIAIRLQRQGETLMRTPFSLSRHLLAAVLLTAFCLPCWAQQGNLRTVLFVKLKLDQEENWKTTVKDYTAILKKIQN
jgi:hypothetical protein